ncbi:hypothetical protein GlitD10_1065 [Gloeomargarita lithophora Alchichica-D10]|uniref:Uncharacterized protein n=1 Tax=Gloeomargarita lithophora Alchichica-D10 TaxID=1188229 RepID=A0A1J0ABV8_9CYAN|nr:DUF2281 domain-containing protein [Gloeomargarita lithophora]APB33385.1 hypothetical protein GlitD10_1065 [Gloeomargarita lithophora Alchichica-D10]
MTTTEMEILKILRQLPPPALAEVKVFLDFLSWRYQTTPMPSQHRGIEMLAAMRGKATAGMTTDEILELTRGAG